MSGARYAGGECKTLPARVAFPISQAGKGERSSPQDKGEFVHENALTMPRCWGQKQKFLPVYLLVTQGSRGKDKGGPWEWSSTVGSPGGRGEV